MDTTLIQSILVEATERVPQNEAQVSQCVIVPILTALGYHKWDILPQASDNSGRYPDYTILPSTDYTWYLEVKKWTSPLEDRFAIQALDYANHNGRRWVVLTNGQTWRLYDNLIQGQTDSKVVVEASITEPAALISLLEALSADSVRQGLERFSTIRRLHLTLAGELQRDDSDLIRAMLQALVKRPGMEHVTGSDIVRTLSALHPTRAPIVESKQSANIQPSETPPLTAGTEPSRPHDTGQTLADLKVEPKRFRGTKPSSVRFPDGSSQTVTSWAGLTEAIVRWFAAHNAVPPLPFCVPFKANYTSRAFLNHQPIHPNGTRMEHPCVIAAGTRPLYLNTHTHTIRKIVSLVYLCDAVGQPPSGFLISFRDQEPQVSTNRQGQR